MNRGKAQTFLCWRASLRQTRTHFGGKRARARPGALFERSVRDDGGEAAVGLHIRSEPGWVRFAKFAAAIDFVLYTFRDATRQAPAPRLRRRAFRFPPATPRPHRSGQACRKAASIAPAGASSPVRTPLRTSTGSDFGWCASPCQRMSSSSAGSKGKVRPLSGPWIAVRPSARPLPAHCCRSGRLLSGAEAASRRNDRFRVRSCRWPRPLWGSKPASPGNGRSRLKAAGRNVCFRARSPRCRELTGNGS